MKNVFIIVAIVFPMLLGPGSRVLAQRPVGIQVEIDELAIDDQRTPDFGTRTHNRARRPSEDWLQIVARLSTTAEQGWIPELTLNWHVMIDGGETPRLYYQTSTTYVDIENGRDNYAVVYIRPENWKRLFGSRLPRNRNLVVYLEVEIGNAIVAEESYNPGRMQIPNDWWRSPRLNRVPDALLAPDKTPFQWLDYEFYMPLKITE